MLKIGVVAKKTGLTIRALRHYDEIGLLSPSHRTEAGYRLYTMEDLQRLQKIKSLQHLGFSLETVAGLLQQSDSLPSILKQHIDSLNAEMEQQQALLERLKQLSHVLESNKKPSVELLLDTLRLTVMFEKYYTKEQLQKLEERRKQMGEGVILQAQKEWESLFEKFKILKDQGKPASSKEAQQLAMRANELVEMFTGGDPGIAQSLQNFCDAEFGGPNMVSLGMNIDKVLFAYLQEAMAIARKS